MTTTEAVKLLRSVQGLTIQEMEQRVGLTFVREAIRTVRYRKKTNPEVLDMAEQISQQILHQKFQH